MRLVVIGASGRTGRLVVGTALERGHEVVAAARTPAAVRMEGARLDLVEVDVTHPETLPHALDGADAVVSALGVGTGRAPTELYSRGIANILSTLPSGAPLAVISATPVGPREEQPFVERRIAMPLLERFFGATYADMRRMEALLAASEANWISVRPPRLVEKPGTNSYRLALEPIPKGRSIRLADLASALLDVTARPELYGKAVYVAE